MSKKEEKKKQGRIVHRSGIENTEKSNIYFFKSDINFFLTEKNNIFPPFHENYRI